MSDSLQLHRLQHTRLPCPSQSSWVCSNSCPLSQQCQLTISSSVALLSFCLQAFPASGSFPVSWLFASGAHSTESSASASVLPMKILAEPLNTLVFDDFSTQLNGSQTSLLQPSLKLGSSNQMHLCQTSLGVPGGSNGKESSCNARDPGSIPGLGRSPREGNGYPLQYSCLENSIERGDWLSN